MFEWQKFNMLSNSNVLEPAFTSGQQPDKQPSFLSKYLLKKYLIKKKPDISTRFSQSPEIFKNTKNSRNTSLNSLSQASNQYLSINSIPYRRSDKHTFHKSSLKLQHLTPTPHLEPEKSKFTIKPRPTLPNHSKMIVNGIKNSIFSPKSSTNSPLSYSKSIKYNESPSESPLSNIRLLKRLKNHKIFTNDYIKSSSIREISKSTIAKNIILIP